MESVGLTIPSVNYSTVFKWHLTARNDKEDAIRLNKHILARSSISTKSHVPPFPAPFMFNDAFSVH